MAADSILKYDFKEGLPHEFEIVDLALLYTEFADEMTTPHRTEFYQIIWFESGDHKHMVDFDWLPIEPNTMLFVNKNSVQQFDPNGRFEGKAMLFTDGFFCKTETDTKFLKSTILFNDLLAISLINVQATKALYANLLKHAAAELNRPKDNYQSDILLNHLRNLLLHAERERRQQGFTELKRDADLDHVLLFKAHLDKHYIQHKQVSFYCDTLHITPKKLNQATTKVFGKTPKEVIDERVLLEAKRLLAHTNDSVKELGFSLGFDEPTNFIKYFRKHTHKTPADFRSEVILA